MLAFAVFIAEIIALGKVPDFNLIIVFSLLVPIFSEMGSFALNDYFDIESDRTNKKNGPLVTGAIKPKTAFAFSIICIVISIILAYFISQIIFLITLIFNILAIAYNVKLKDLPLVGNLYIATTMAIPFIFGNLVISEIKATIIVLALLGFIAGLAREIIKSVQDMEGDRKARASRTLPIVIGEKAALIVAVILDLIFIPLSFIPLIGVASIFPWILVGIANLLIVVICYKLITKKDFKFARNISLVVFVLGMIGILFGTLLV